MEATRRSFLTTAGVGVVAAGFGAVGLGAAGRARADSTAGDPASALSIELCGGQLPDTALRGIARAQIFDSLVPDKSVYAGRVAYTWAAETLSQPPEVVPSKYIPIQVCPDPTLTLSWFQQNHPDWVVYKADRVSNAFSGAHIAVDIMNEAMRDWFIDSFVDPAVQAGWPIIAWDIVNPRNYYQRSGHYDLSGNWVQQYDGSLEDEAWASDLEDWYGYLADYLHAQQVAVSGNIALPPNPTAFSKTHLTNLLTNSDMWLDEVGFIQSYATNVSLVTDAAWEYRVETIRATPYVVFIGRTTTDHLADADDAQVNYEIANYLLLREYGTTLALTGKSEYGYFVDRPELNFDIGYAVSGALADSSGIWRRHYSEGLTLVNPSSTSIKTATLPGGTWVDSSGSIYSGTATMANPSGLVLKRNC